MKYLELFAGIGGFALGAYWAGIKFDGHYFSEIDEYAISVYQKRFPDAIFLGDIRKIHLMGVDREVQNGDEQYIPPGDWIISGGFPCQDISVAGKGAGLDGDRSGLWFEYARLISEIRPRFAIMENVGALTVRGLDRVLGNLAEIGYDAIWQDIRASDVGAPHRRERIWIIAYPADWNADRPGLCGGEDSNTGGIRHNVVCAQGGKPRKPPQWEGWQDSCGGSEEKFFSNPRCAGVYKRGISGNVGGSGRQPGGIFRNGLQGRREEKSGILADSQEQQRPVERQKTFVPGRGGPALADTNGLRLEYGGKKQNGTGEQNLQEQSEGSGIALADSEQPGLEGQRGDTGQPPFPEPGHNGTKIPYAGDIWSLEWQRKLRSDKQIVPGGEDNGRGAEIDAIREWWATEPPVCCLVDGLPAGMDGYEGRICNNAYRRVPQLKGLGNAIVPHIAMLIWLMIREFL